MKKLIRIHTLAVGLLLSGLMGCQQPAPAPQEPTSTPLSTPSASITPQICCGGQGSESSVQQPEMDLLTKNFGTIAQGKELLVPYPIENLGTEVAKLAGEVTFSYPCCVEVEVPKKTLEPGEKMDVVVKLDSEFRPGPLDVFVNLPFQGGKVPTKLHLGGVVRPEVVVSPTGLKFGEVDESIQFEVSGEALFTEFDVTGIENNYEEIEVNEVSRDDARIIYEVTWHGSPEDNEFREIAVLTDHPEVRRYPIVIAPPGAKI